MQSVQFLFWALALCALTAVSAVFAAAETRMARRRALGSPESVAAEKAIEADRKVQRSLFAYAVGGGMAMIAAGWIGAALLFPSLLEAAFGSDTAPIATRGLVSAVSFLITCAIVVPFGQLAPRRIAGRRTGRNGVSTPPSAKLLGALALPFALAAVAVTNVALRLFSKGQEQGQVIGPDELRMLVLRSHKYDKRGAAQRELIERLFDFSEAKVRDVMTPKAAMACIGASMRAKEAIDLVRHVGFTRFPICEGDKDRVIGVVHMRDLIDAADARPRSPVTDVMRPTIHLGPDRSVSEALKEMRQNRVHMAAVVDDGGKTLGLVTLEDLLDDLLGEAGAPLQGGPIASESLGAYEFSGEMTVEEVEDALDVDLEHVGVQSIGSYLFGKFGRKPTEGDSIKIAGITFDVIEMQGTRVARLRAQRSREAPPPYRQADGS